MIWNRKKIRIYYHLSRQIVGPVVVSNLTGTQTGATVIDSLPAWFLLPYDRRGSRTGDKRKNETDPCMKCA